MKSFKHFKEDSDSDDRGSEFLSKLKSRKELAKQRSLETLQRFKERSSERDKETASEVQQAAGKRSDDAAEMKAKNEIHRERTRQQRQELGDRAKKLVKKGIKRILKRK